jgi:ketosteroid isomerase-like protein
MSAQNVQIVRTLLGYWGTPDMMRTFELLHEDVEIELADEMIGFAARHRGFDAVRRFWREWLSAWEYIAIERADVTGRGEEVLSTWTQTMKGKGSDVEMKQDNAAIWTLSDGRVTRIRFFFDCDRARAEFARG